MNAVLGLVLMASTVLLFHFLRTYPRTADQLLLAIPFIWIPLPMFVIVGFIAGAVLVVRSIAGV